MASAGQLLVAALAECTPETLVAGIEGEQLPSGAASVFVQELGSSDRLRRALQACREARLDQGEWWARRAADDIDGLERELPGALKRLAEGEAVNVDGVDDKVRTAFESVLAGCGLLQSPRPELDGDIGYAAMTQGDKRTLAELAVRLRPMVGPTMPSNTPEVSTVDHDIGDPGPRPADGEERPVVQTKRQRLEMRDQGDGCSKREAWMLSPPADSELRPVTWGAAKATFSRAKASDAKPPAPDHPELQAAKQTLDAFRAERGPALVDIHRQQKLRTQPKCNSFSWSRDDMAKPRKLDASAAESLIKSAKNIDGRFTSSVESSFM